MAQKSSLEPTFVDFGGVDYRSHDASRKPRFAKDSQNVELDDNGSLISRQGQAILAANAGGGGFLNYVRTETDRSITTEQITIDDNLWRKKTSTISVRYTGGVENSSAAIVAELNNDNSYSFRFQLTSEDVEVLDFNLGRGLDELNPVTIIDLVNEINNLVDFTASYTGDGTVPAAFLEANISIPISSVEEQLVSSAGYWEQIHCPTENPFADFWADANTANFENACIINHSAVALIATGANKLYAYDGISCYAAGMPSTEDFVANNSPSGVLSGTYRWFITYQFIDARGNVIEGEPSNEIEVVLSGNSVEFTIPTIEDDTEYLHSYAYGWDNGPLTGTTITVDNGNGGNPHTLQAGHTAFFRNSSGNLKEIEITAVTANTITLAESVTILNNEPISANLRINLWRNKAGDFNKYLVRSFANRPDVASFTYTDNLSDSALGSQYTLPKEGRFLPRENLKYLTVFQNILIGSDGNGSQIFVGTIEGPWYSNGAAEDFILIRSKTNLPVTSVAANREVLAVFKSTETHVIQGDLTQGNIRVELASSSTGCDAHATVRDIDNALWFYSGNGGVQRIISNDLLRELSYRIDPFLQYVQENDELKLIHKRAVAVDYPERKQYLLWIPRENTVDGTVRSNQDSILFCADYRSQDEDDNDYDKEGRLVAARPKIRWWPWTGFNMAGGADVVNGRLYWMQRRYSFELSQFEYQLVYRPTMNEETDNVDFAEPYTLIYESGWDDFGADDLEKKMVGATIYSFDKLSAPAWDFTCHTEINYRNDVVHSRKTFQSAFGGSSTGWGNMPWGDFAWGEDDDNRQIFPFRRTRARTIKMVFTAEIWRSKFAVSGWVIEVVPAYKPKQTK